ncbi:uncharacterized protein LOC126827300 [Patella vulgata]|uniref:uncharacterized protein LOC126827300 n=1 Tax=Patella vulgata TaxID=6465 RepID=UPI0024A8138E|nr:uncharacterized protein LOC126827300 [Patella vulgata]
MAEPSWKLVWLTLLLLPTVISYKCVQRSSRDIRPDPRDCSMFYICISGSIYKYSCQHNVYDPYTASCVPKHSKHDTCSKVDGRTQQWAQKRCPPISTSLLPHPTNCAQFYNCSKSAMELGWEDNLQECPYPQLYNVQRKRCEHYSMVQCDSRKEPFSQCDYMINQCRTSHCIPCSVRYPSCVGLPDGLNVWKDRSESPYFVVCKGNRAVYTGSCGSRPFTQIFDSRKRMCVDKQSLI